MIWLDVNKKLPKSTEQHKFFLVTCLENKKDSPPPLVIARYSENGWQVVNEWQGHADVATFGTSYYEHKFFAKMITHWMRIPEVPVQADFLEKIGDIL